MTSYLIALIDQHDPAKHWATTAYGPRFGQLLEKYGGSMVAATDIEQVEGLPLAEPRAAIFEFPTIEAVRGFWNDPGYQEVVELRRQLGTFQIFMLAGKDESLSEGGRQAIEAQQRQV